MAVSFVGPAWNNNNHSTGTTIYEYIGGATGGRSNTTESVVQRKIFAGRTGVFKNLYHALTLNQSSPSGPSCTFRVNGADTALTIDIPQGATGNFENVTDKVAVIDGDLVCFEFLAPSGGVANREWKTSVWFDADEKKHAITLAQSTGGAVFQTNNNVEWTGLWGTNFGDQSSESFTQSRFFFNGDARHARVRLSLNSGSTDNTQTLRINEADSALVIEIPGGMTGFFENVTDAVTIQYGDRVNWIFATSSSGASVTTTFNQVDITTFKGGTFHLGNGPRNTHNSNQTRYTQFWGGFRFDLTAASWTAHPITERLTFGFLSVGISQNAGTGSEASVAVLKDSADTDLGITIPKNATGQFTDVSSTEKFSIDEDMSVRLISTGGGAQIGWRNVEMLGTEQPKFRIEPAAFNIDPETGLPLGLGQTVCVQIGGAQTVPADPPVGALVFSGVEPFVPQNAKIIPIPAGSLCIRGPHAAAVDVPIAIPVGALVFAGLAPPLDFELHPGLDALLLAGLAPTLFEESIRQPASGTLVLAGLTPVLDFELHPGLDALVLAGLVPTLFFEVAAQPPSGALVLAGLAPPLDFELHPGLDALVLNGLTPTLFITVLSVPGVGALVLGGLAPPLDFGLHPGLDALLLEGQAPAAFRQRTFAVPSGTLVLAGLAPLRVIGTVRIPPVGALVLNGLAPNLFEESIRIPGEDTLILQGLTPTRLTGLPFFPPTGALVLAGQTPTRFVEERRFPGTGTLVLAGLAPVRSIGIVRIPPVGALVFNGLAPTLATGVARSPGTGALVLAGLAPAAFRERTFPPGSGVLSLSGLAIHLDFELHPGLDALVLAGLAPVVFIERVAAPGSGTLLLAGLNPTLDFELHPGLDALVFAGLVPTIIEAVGAVARAPGVGSLVLAGQTPVRSIGIGRAPAVGALVFQGLAPTVTITLQPPFVFAMPVGTLVLQGLVPLVQFNTVPTGTLVLAGLVPTRRQTLSIVVPLRDLRLDGHAPGIEGDLDIQIPIQTQLRFGGMTPVPAHGLGVPTGTLVLNGDAPTTGGVACPSPAALVFAGLQPVGATFFDIPTGSLVFAGLAPALTSPIICVDAAALVLSGTVNVEAALATAMTAGSLVLAGHAPESVILSGTFDVPTTFTLRRLRQAPYIEQEAGRIFHERFQLNLQIGVGLGTGTAEENDPQITLDWSDNNTRTWSNPYPVSAGPIGTSLNIRALWYRLGRSRNRIYRVTMTAPVKWALIDAYIQVKPGTN